MAIGQIFKVLWHGEVRDARYLGMDGETTLFDFV